jgi:hypothetical protein
MNHCNDQGGKPRQQHSCDALGVCQECYPACGGCFTRHDTARMTAPVASGPRFAFAPGVIDGGEPSRRQLFKRLAWAAAWWLGCGLLAGLAAGLVAGAIQ